MSANTLTTTGGGNEMTAPITGLLGKCNVMTMQGERAISKLAPGDRIITRNGMRVLREVKVTQHTFRAISVGKGTLGYTRPAEDMLMAPGQEVMVRDWRAEILFGRNAVIIPIDRMIDGKYIAQNAELAEHAVYELRFDQEEIYFADGVEIISKLETTEMDDMDLVTAA